MARIEAFGITADGRAVDKITLSSGDLTVALLTWGAVVQSVRLAGVGHDLTLGSDRLPDYEGAMCFHGAVLAPVANRIGHARAKIAGREYAFEANQAGHCLHAGSTGAHLQVWEVVTADDSAATLALALPDGLGGFPGNRRVEARFSLTGATLRLELRATTDAPTLWNATNHSYWALDGAAGFAGQGLQIAADRVLDTDADARPTGAILPVAGSAMDFRTPRALTPGAPPLDHNFCLSDAQAPLREVLHLQGRSGVSLRVATTEPGVQIYDARGASQPYDGLAIETQFWPDAPSYPNFPSILLPPDETRVQVTEWRFSKA